MLADGSSTDAAPARPAAEAAGTLIAGRYKLLQQIGEGGMGTVWMADQTEPVRRRVAVKLIRVERMTNPGRSSPFEAGHRRQQRLDRPHIAKLLDAGSTLMSSFFVMELVRGDFRSTFLRRAPGWASKNSNCSHSPARPCSTRPPGDHPPRLKPSNILVREPDGKPMPKVIDFGLAKATSTLQLSEHALPRSAV